MGFIGYFVKLIHIPMYVLPCSLPLNYTYMFCSNNILVYVLLNTLIRVLNTNGFSQRRRISYLFGVRRLWATGVLYSRAYIISAASYPAPSELPPLPALSNEAQAIHSTSTIEQRGTSDSLGWLEEQSTLPAHVHVRVANACARYARGSMTPPPSHRKNHRYLGEVLLERGTELRSERLFQHFQVRQRVVAVLAECRSGL
jgi:hypothetical protein